MIEEGKHFDRHCCKTKHVDNYSPCTTSNLCLEWRFGYVIYINSGLRVGQQSDDIRSIVGQQWVNSRPTVDLQSAYSRPTVG